METFFLMRHGETAWNKQRRVMGSLEIPLDRAGIKQAAWVAEVVSELGLNAIYTSPLKRAAQTANILARRASLPVTEEPGLTEFAFGRWAGCTYEDLVHDPLYHSFLNAPLATRLPGGETIRDVQRRGLSVVQRAAAEFPGGRCLLVTHGDVIRAVLCHYLRLPLQEFRRLRIDNGSLSVLQADRKWAEIKVINYLPEVADVCKEPEPYAGVKPSNSRKQTLTVTGRRRPSKP